MKMITYKWFIFAIFGLFCATSSFAATQDVKISRTIVIDPSGKGDFRTIQAAINSIPPNNKRWIVIEIKKGIYREKVKIPSNKPYIYLKGAGRQNTIIEGNDHGPIDTSAVFTSEADHTMARGLTFNNSYTAPPNADHRAVAARIIGDKSAFYKCRFFGFQDTLWDVQGRHYFRSCTIEGAIDFIFGDGQSMYEGCIISVRARTLGTLGYITAQGRENPNATSGFVFKQCSIIGDGKAYLGRPWRNYARVIFYDTKMSDVVAPEGWQIWNSAGHEGQLTFSEYNSYGSGAKSSKRVKWATKLNAREVNKLANISFIDDVEGWVAQSLSLLGGA